MGKSYDITGKTIDGMNVLTVYEAVSEAAQRARTKGEASFLEVKTYRYKGHSMSDPGTYRSRDEVEDYKKQDPLLIMREYLDEKGFLDDEHYKKMDQECREICNEAAEFAENDAEPRISSLFEDVYA
jgi:pyruvate dehydrogenase E1 component alpha subunit